MALQTDYEHARPSPSDREVRAASSTDPAIVLSKFDIWTYSCEADEWKRLPRVPLGDAAVAVLSADPPIVVCKGGSVFELNGDDWELRKPLPGSMADETAKEPERRIF